MEEEEEELGLGEGTEEDEDPEERDAGSMEGEPEENIESPPRSSTPAETDVISQIPNSQNVPEHVDTENVSIPHDSVDEMLAETEPKTVAPPNQKKGPKTAKKPLSKTQPPELLTKTERKSKSRSLPDIALPDDTQGDTTESKPIPTTPGDKATAEPAQSELSKREKRKLREAKKALESGSQAIPQVSPPTSHSYFSDI